jgi:DNA end-binding protein Ku
VIVGVVAIAVGAAASRFRSLAALPPTPMPEQPREKLDGLTRAELYERARDADIPGRSQMTKAQLIEALRSQRH